MLAFAHKYRASEQLNLSCSDAEEVSVGRGLD